MALRRVFWVLSSLLAVRWRGVEVVFANSVGGALSVWPRTCAAVSCNIGIADAAVTVARQFVCASQGFADPAGRAPVGMNRSLFSLFGSAGILPAQEA